MGLLKGIFKRLLNFSVLFLTLVLLPGLPPPTTFEFESYVAAPPVPLEGVFAPNNLLDNTERLFENEIFGPEHLLYFNQALYTGIQGGELVKIVGTKFEHVTKIGKPCVMPVEETKCGRILGIAADTLEKNSLILVDTYYGIYQYNLGTGKQTQLVSTETVLDGDKPRRTRMMNSVAVAKNGDFYWTDSSSDFNIENGLYILLSNPSGRLFHYDRKNNVNRVLADHLNFANGLALSPNEDFLVVAETTSGRLNKFHLKGPRTGEMEIFVDGLPGIPDNLTPDRDGIWVPMVVTRDSENPFAPLVISRAPWLRKFLVRFITSIETPFLLIEKYFPNSFTATLTHYIGTLNTPFLFPKRSTVLRVNWQGEVVKVLHGFDGSVGGISHVEQVNDYLYFGSPYGSFVGRKYFKADASSQKTQQAPTTTQRPTTTTTTQRPTTTTTTTTTQRPTTTTTTTQRPTTTTTTTTTQRPTTTTTTTTTQRPTTTTTTTQRPTTTTTTTTTQRPTTTTTTTQRPTTTTTTTPEPLFEDEYDDLEIEEEQEEELEEEPPKAAKPTPAKPKAPEPAPIHEKRQDTTPPPPPKLKVIKKGGEQGEL